MSTTIALEEKAQEAVAVDAIAMDKDAMVAALSWVKHRQYSTSWTAITSSYKGEQ